LAREIEEALPLLPDSFDGCAPERAAALPQDHLLSKRFSALKELLKALRSSVNEPSAGLAPYDVRVKSVNDDAAIMIKEAGSNGLREFLGSATVTVVEEPILGDEAISAGGYSASLTPARGQSCPRCRLLNAETESALCGRCHEVVTQVGKPKGKRAASAA